MRSGAIHAAVMALALSAGMVTTAGAQTVKIGVNEPLTGPFAASGTYVVNGARIAADEINANGGVLGRKVELVIEDNKSNPTEAAAVAEKLITSDKVPVIMGAWGSSLTLAVMPKLLEYKVPLVVETSSSSKITTSGNPYVFRLSPPSTVEAEEFKAIAPRLNIKKADFLVINNDWGRGSAEDFGRVLKGLSIGVGIVEIMDQAAQDMTAQLAKIKATDSDTIMVTTAVEQLTLVLKQAAALGITKRIVTTGGSQNPDQLIEQARAAANGTLHLTTFAPWDPEKTPDPPATKYFIAEWKKRGFAFAGVTESFRGYDGIRAIAKSIEVAGKAEPDAIVAALWKLEFMGLNGRVKFEKEGPAGKESGQSRPSLYLIKIENDKVVLLGS